MKGPPAMLNERERRHPVLLFLAYLFIIALLAVSIADIVLLQRYYVVEVAGPSMMNTLYGGTKQGARYVGGDILYARREAEAERGDVVIIDVSEYSEFSREGEHYIIKRLIAKEGDSVKCEDGIVYLKAAGTSEYTLLPEPYITGKNTVNFERTLAEGQIFVMGDNREVSLDSRRIEATLLYDDIIGVVPEWSIEHKSNIKAWENIREFLVGWIK